MADIGYEMPCYKPLSAWRVGKNPFSGKDNIVFKAPAKKSGLKCDFLQLPCGRCIGCRLERSRQ